MRVGQFIKRLINPEVDQTEDPLAAQLHALEENSPLASESDETPRGKLFDTEGEIQEVGAGDGPEAIFADESREEIVLPELDVEPELPPDLPPEQVPQLSLLTAVALHEALSVYAPDLRIKWPNDLLFRGAKVAGILTEMRAEPGHVHAVVLGFGINLKAPVGGWPSDITQAVTDMTTISAQPRISKLEIAVAVLEALDRWYDVYLSDGFAPLRVAWWQAHAASGGKVRVHHGNGYIEGIASALDEDGALLLQTSHGMERIIAGDLELL